MGKIYIVETGEYSNKKVVAAFSTEQQACDFISKYKYETDANYFEIELDSQEVNRAELSLYHCDITQDGSATCWLEIDKDEKIDDLTDLFMIEPIITFGSSHGNKYNWFRVRGWFRNEEHAAKVTAEKYAKFIYENPDRRVSG